MVAKHTHDVSDAVEDVTNEVKEVANEATEKAKELLEESKKTVENFVDKVVDEDKINSYWSTVKGFFQGATIKDWIFFVAACVLFLVALAGLAEFILPVLALLGSIVLFNIFLSRSK